MVSKRVRNTARLLFGAVSDSQIKHAYRVRVWLFVVSVVLTVAVLVLITQGTQTLHRLDVVERERDSWQRPDDVIEPLRLKDGKVVAEVGCGAGYFALKLASKVGEHGNVLAEDILREPLAFLWIRALLRHQGNVRVVHGDLDNPHLPKEWLDAVLIANTYHEFTNPQSILGRTFQALRSDGRLVVLDRGPRSYHGESRATQMQQSQITAALVESDIRQSGFEVVSG